MINNLQFGWVVACACSVTVALALPRRQWTWKVLAGLSALADIVEWHVMPNTKAYFYTWWAFRIVELLWLAFATSHLMERMHPVSWHQGRRFHWYPLLVSCCAVIACGPWETSSQMQLLQSFILIACALPTWLYAFIFWDLHLLPFALSILLASEIACALYWRWAGYHVAGWFLAWAMGMILLWVADRRDQLS